MDTKSLPPCQRPGDVGRDKDHRIDLEEVNFAFSGFCHESCFIYLNYIIFQSSFGKYLGSFHVFVIGNNAAIKIGCMYPLNCSFVQVYAQE